MDEAQAGFASNIDVVLCADGSVSITDDGRGVWDTISVMYAIAHTVNVALYNIYV